jgi:hypothetical protein
MARLLLAGCHHCEPNIPPGEGASGMPVLTEPDARVHASFVEAVREYRAEGRYARLDPADLADLCGPAGQLARLACSAGRCVYMD